MEFSTPLTPWPSPSFSGTGNGMDVQFVTSGTCEVDYGVINPDDYCDYDDLMVGVDCYVNGSGIGNTDPGFIVSDYLRDGDPSAGKVDAPVSIADFRN